MGNQLVAATDAATKSSSSSFLPLLIIVVLFGLFYVTIIRPQRNRQRAAQQTQHQVMPGQRIRSTAGIYGTVISGDDRDIVVEIAPGVQVTGPSWRSSPMMTRAARRSPSPRRSRPRTPTRSTTALTIPSSGAAR
jgi:preprotein translocase YajC subunit